MALVTFRSRAASAILMYVENAQTLLEIIGKPMAERGVITASQLDDALARLLEAVARDDAAGAPDDARAAATGIVRLRQRAYPLIEMLRAARRRSVDVTWGI